jgi:site-specific recombinase XerD
MTIRRAVMLGKQAKVLNDQQVKAVLKYLESCKRNSLRNQVMFLLSLHGMRAMEVAELQISMITTSEGQISDLIALEDKASKGKSGRMIPMNKVLRELLTEYVGTRASTPESFVVITERSEKFSANAVAVFFKRLYKKLGYSGCSSHSGRRTFITNCARKISLAGGSMRDVMNLAGHSNLQTTQKYVEQNPEAQNSVVKMLYSSIN